MFGSKYNYDRFTRSQLLKEMVRHEMRGPEPGEKAPDFELKTLDGEKVRLSDFRGKQNVVLSFGSATCPMTAGSVRGLNELYSDYDDDDVQFVLVYVREAHPGEKLPAHDSMDDKTEAAETLRDEEDVQIPIAIDDVDGKVHRKYGAMPNSSYIIDKSGRIAFRAMWTRPSRIQAALDELLERQKKGDKHAVVRGGEDRSVPVRYGIFYSHRALERGGQDAKRDFREAMGPTGRFALTASRMAGPIVLHPGRAFAGAALAGGVIVAALIGGMKLREQRLRMRSPYNFPRTSSRKESGSGYEAVGI